MWPNISLLSGSYTNDLEEEQDGTAYHNTGAIYNKSPESPLIQSQNILLNKHRSYKRKRH